MQYLPGRTLWREEELEGVRQLEMKRKKKKKDKAKKSMLSFADEEEEGLDAEEEGAGPDTTLVRPLPTAPPAASSRTQLAAAPVALGRFTAHRTGSLPAIPLNTSSWRC